MRTDEHRCRRGRSFILRVNVPGSAIPSYLCLSVLICGCSCFLSAGTAQKRKGSGLMLPHVAETGSQKGRVQLIEDRTRPLEF